MLFDAMNKSGVAWRIGLLLLVLGAVGFGTKYCSETNQAAKSEKALHCLDKICEGDTPPNAGAGEVVFKLNGSWYFAPRAYALDFSTLAFYWPSKTPATGRPDRQPYPERGQDFYTVAVEIFLSSGHIPNEPQGYQLIELAQTRGWIESRTTLRPGLDAIKMKHVIGPRDQYIDHVTYYVATQLKGTDGLPPVATCAHRSARDIGGTGFLWRPGIAVGTRMNQKHCADWPEIFEEITRVLQLVRKG